MTVASAILDLRTRDVPDDPNHDRAVQRPTRMPEPNYYVALLRQIPGLLVDSAGRVTAVTFVLACAAGGFFSSKVVNALITPGWWALIAVAAVLLVAFLRSNHKYVKTLQLRASAQPASGSSPQHYYYGPVTQYIGTIRTGEEPISGVGLAQPIDVETKTADPQQDLPFDEGSSS
jgi:hypothetical protein